MERACFHTASADLSRSVLTTSYDPERFWHDHPERSLRIELADRAQPRLLPGLRRSQWQMRRSPRSSQPSGGPYSSPVTQRSKRATRQGFTSFWYEGGGRVARGPLKSSDP